MSTTTTIRIGTASPATGPTTSATLVSLAALARRAAGLGIDLLVLLEAYLGGYPRGASFGCVVGDRTAQGRDEFERYFDAAVDLGDTVGDGAGAGARWIRRKLGDGGDSTGTERLVWAQGSPSTLRAVSTTLHGTRVNLAAAICWENYMPLLRQSLYAQNINLYLAPTADQRDAWLGLMRTIGVEGRCFVVSSNMCVRRGAQSEVLPSAPSAPPKHHRRSVVYDEDGNEIILCRQDTDGAVKHRSSTQTASHFVSRGGSCIVSPFGDVLAGPQWEDEDGLIYADVDMRDCIRGRLDMDTAGSYSRNDTFKLTVPGLDMDPLPY